jgi:hypothetical protein
MGEDFVEETQEVMISDVNTIMINRFCNNYATVLICWCFDIILIAANFFLSAVRTAREIYVIGGVLKKNAKIGCFVQLLPSISSVLPSISWVFLLYSSKTARAKASCCTAAAGGAAPDFSKTLISILGFCTMTQSCLVHSPP